MNSKGSLGANADMHSGFASSVLMISVYACPQAAAIAWAKGLVKEELERRKSMGIEV